MLAVKKCVISCVKAQYLICIVLVLHFFCRFGNHKFTVEEFADLMNLLLEMVAGIQKID